MILISGVIFVMVVSVMRLSIFIRLGFWMLFVCSLWFVLISSRKMIFVVYRCVSLLVLFCLFGFIMVI